LAARGGVLANDEWTPPESWRWRELPERAEEETPLLAMDGVAEIHARWLMTPRDDLRAQTPREVLLSKNDFLSRDIFDRQHQWAVLGECPPGLDHSSAAFRYAGFGTHEIVMYYDLVRHLIWQCWGRLVEPDHGNEEQEAASGQARKEDEVARLHRARDEWLSSPQHDDLHGRTPAEVIERERARLPAAVSGEEAMVDPDCPMCQMMAEDCGPMFWHLDGSSMDYEFPFSFLPTREAFEEQERSWEESRRKYEEERKQEAAESEWTAEAAAEETETPSVWKRTFGGDVEGESPSLWVFGIGAHLAELVTDLKEKADTQSLIDDLNRQFGNLREVMVQQPSNALLDPVVQRFSDELNELGRLYPDLAEKCEDLERQLTEGTQESLGPNDREASEWDDEDVPF